MAGLLYRERAAIKAIRQFVTPKYAIGDVVEVRLGLWFWFGLRFGDVVEVRFGAPQLLV